MKTNRFQKCRVCSTRTSFLFKKRVMRKYPASYFICPRCKFIQTERPYWLKEAYREPIAKEDTGILSRNIILSKITALVILFFFDVRKKHLDYAGGYGLLTRLMRDYGYNFYWYDSFTDNLFAKEFEATKPYNYQLLTSFEFMEHIPEPLEDLEKVLSEYKAQAFLFSTVLYKEPIDEKWWYFTFNTGQHVSLYHINTLKYLAKRLKLYFYSNGVNIHMFSKTKVNPVLFYLLTRFGVFLAFLPRLFLKSKTFSDHESIINKEI